MSTIIKMFFLEAVKPSSDILVGRESTGYLDWLVGWLLDLKCHLHNASVCMYICITDKLTTCVFYKSNTIKSGSCSHL